MNSKHQFPRVPFQGIIGHFSFVTVLAFAIMLTLRGGSETIGESEVVDTDREKVAIAALFSELSDAAKQNDKVRLVTHFVPSLRQEVTDGVERDLGEELGVIRNVYEPWRSAVARHDIIDLSCPFEIVMFRAYNLKHARLWEVCIRFDSEKRHWTSLWYFVATEDELLVADWPFGGDPGRSIKTFDLNRPEQDWR